MADKKTEKKRRPPQPSRWLIVRPSGVEILEGRTAVAAVASWNGADGEVEIYPLRSGWDGPLPLRFKVRTEQIPTKLVEPLDG